ncbi:hypothetical protein VB715_12965 [Crocosphaera sp. UHCC 0190]|uniref:DUF6816 family protein n=1 Tax=Crocosphaera sp. UHCC 0190 TaxID=3110246 RepID=UPI002B1EC87B|nr:hypothetical protein [Crocosphaera sp. UHCC 0190]MEA5510677.1 hypothetical protein [Crocosphaera sp. UHCC 0190]
MRILIVFLAFIIILLANVSPSQAGELLEHIQTYPDWNKPLNLSQAQGDLVYPDWMEGTWNVTSILLDQVAPLAPEIVTPGFKNNQRYLNQPLHFQVRFQKQSSPIPNIFALASFISSQLPIVANREFNGYQIAKAYLGKDATISVKNDPNNPNRQITFLSQNNQLISTVTERQQERPKVQTFVATEITQQIFQRPSSIYINEVETTTNYHLIADNKIEAEQITAIYLSPKDPDYFKAINRPIALYKYQLNLSRNLNITNIK